MTATMIKPGEKHKFPITRTDSHFDRACESAYRIAIGYFGCDENGYLTYVEDFDRSTDSVVVRFVGYEVHGGYIGVSHIYTFEAWVERYEEDV